MPKKENLPMSGYIPDIKANKPFLQTYNRHNDSYSVFDLRPEIILISSRLSQLLCALDDQDETLLPHCWGEIMSLIECKRKLIETITKASEVAFKHQQMERMNDARIQQMTGTKLPLEDVEEIIRSILQSAETLMTEDDYQLYVKEIQLKLKQTEEAHSK